MANEYRAVQVRIYTGDARQVLQDNGWTMEEVDHLFEMYFAGIMGQE